MPWGKYKGVRIRMLPDNYLSFLTTIPLMREPQWKWLLESLLAELRFRGLNVQGLFQPDMTVELPPLANRKNKRAIGEL